MSENTIGWLKLHRTMLDNYLWHDKPFSKGQAWIDLLLIAEPKDTKMIYKGEVIELKRGTVNRSITSLALRWGWSRNKTRTFLNALKSDSMLDIKATTNRTTLTILKYSDYQDKAPTNGTTKSQRAEQRKGSELNTDKEYKEYKEEKNIVADARFDFFFNLYPKKSDRENALQIFQSKNFTEAQYKWLIDILKEDIESQAWQNDDGKYVPKASKWLEEERYNRDKKSYMSGYPSL